MAKPLVRLNDRHRAACRMRIEGRTAREISAELGVTKAIVHSWFSDPIVKDELTKLRGQIDQVFAERMSDLGMRALSEMEVLMNLELEEGTHVTVGQKLEILQDFMDRLPVTRKQSTPAATGGSVSLQLNQFGDPPSDMSDADLIRMAQQTMGQLPAAVIDATARDGS